jgi:hypothetical protein
MKNDDTNIAVDFLKQLRPAGPWVLTAIIPDGGIITTTVKNADDVRKFVTRYNGKRNLYYSVNPTRQPMKSKAKKTDIAAIEYLPSDLDPKDNETSDAAKIRYLTRLEKLQPTPTGLIDSGNGIQVLFKLAELRYLIRNGVPIEQDRSNAFHHAVGWLKDLRWSRGTIVALLALYPNGIASKYRGRSIDVEVARSFEKIDSEKSEKASKKNNKAADDDEQAPAGIPLTFFDEAINTTNREWIIKGVIAFGETSGWIGPPGKGKSALVTDLTISVASGNDWRG